MNASATVFRAKHGLARLFRNDSSIPSAKMQKIHKLRASVFLGHEVKAPISGAKIETDSGILLF